MDIRHIGLVVSDFEKMINFYQNLGFKFIETNVESGPYIDKLVGLEGACIKTTKLRYNEHFVIELLKYAKPYEMDVVNHQPYAIGFSHIALTVDSITQISQIVVNGGGKIVGPIQFSPDGNVKVVYAKDPEGNIIELVENIK